jgi:hypothetical protein
VRSGTTPSPAGQYSPAGHTLLLISEIFVALDTQYRPTRQRVHLDAPVSLNHPALHGLGVVVFALQLNPAVQVVQFGNAERGSVAFPAPVVREALEYVPVGQLMGVVDACGQYDPDGHGVHCSTANRSVRDEYVPAGQG